MSEEEEQRLLAEYLATCARLHRGFEETSGVIAPLMPMSPDRIDALPIDAETSKLAYLKRFEQFEDILQRTLEAISRIMEHGKIERMTSVDVTRRAYALGILDNEKIWANAVRVRNALAHEYPLNPEKRTSQVNQAWEGRETLNTTWASIQRFVQQEGLLHDAG
ncbi:MAG: hypothetical protein JOY99_17980 [Sphingomonadaceae bacterium]|nr:hypothetical protein [Sphingomonadaceae bacterium]